MRVQINRNDLHPVLPTLSTLAGSSVGNLLGVFGYIHLEAKEQALSLMSTNLETTLRVHLDAEVTTPGTISVPADVFSQFIALLPNQGMVEISLEQNNLVRVDCEGSTATLKGMPAETFPKLLDIESDAVYTLDAFTFKAITEDVLMCASKQDNRPILTGVNFAMSPQGLRLAAADGYRLAVRHTTAIFGDPATFTVMAPALTLLNKLLGKAEEDALLLFSWDSSKAYFALSHLEMTTALVIGNYPNIDPLRPTGITTWTELYTDDLRRAVNLVETFAKDTANSMSIKIAQGKAIEIFGRSQEKGENTSLLDGSIKGEGINISLNYKNLQDILKHLAEEKVVLETVSETVALTLYPLGESDTRYYIIMPMSQS